MGKNIGYLKANRTSKADECLTPYYAVDPILEYVQKDKVIWCPFDKEWSAFVQSLKQNGNKVIYSHKDDGKDFFEYEPDYYDIIISNPPFSCKDKILERLYKLNKPFMMLLPVNSIQGKFRVDLFDKYGLELLIFDGRVDFHTRNNMKETTKGNHFGSAFFCKDILPDKLVFKKLKKYDKSLI